MIARAPVGLFVCLLRFIVAVRSLESLSISHGHQAADF